MADLQPLKFSNPALADYKIKNAAFTIKTVKEYTEMAPALAHNFFSEINIFNEKTSSQFGVFHRGQIQSALGQGMRFIESYGLLQSRMFTPPKPGDKLCLEVPNNIMDRNELLGLPFRYSCFSKEPDLMDAFNLFTDPREMVQFQRMKVGKMAKTLSVWNHIAWCYLLALDPWGDKNADHFNNFTIESILGAKWDDTPIGTLGDDKDGVGAFLKDIKERLKPEIDKELKLKNINSYNIWEWAPMKVDQTLVNKGKKAKKPTAAITADKLKTMYYSNLEVDPHLAAVSVCRCLSYEIDQMLNEVTAKNDSMWPGNLEDKSKDYGKTAPAQGDKAELSDTTKSLFMPISLDRDELVIIMNTQLLKEIKNASLVATGTDIGSYAPYIVNFMKYEDRIIGIDTIPYGAIKLGSKLRYNMWDLYSKVVQDRLGQRDFITETAHKGVVFGIRQYRPFKYIRLTGLYANPAVTEWNIEFKNAVDI